MKKLSLWSAFAVAALIVQGAHAETPQQMKMKTCNADATQKQLAGDARRNFMKQCLSASAETSTLTPQQQKMKTCNADATTQELKGDARKKFMQDCLSK